MQFLRSVAISTIALAMLPFGPSLRAQNERWSDEFHVPGLIGTVQQVIEFRGDLVAAGTVGAGKGAFLDLIGRFDGSRWHSLPGAFSNTHQYPYNAYIMDMAIYQNDLVVVGRFTSVGQAGTAFGVARFDGTRWWSFGQGLPSAADIHAVCVFQGQLYVGGNFGGMPNEPAGIARWNGTSWESVGGPMQYSADGVLAMRVANDGSLWVGGDFTQIGNLRANSIARWTGTQWQALGSTSPGGGLPSGAVWVIHEFGGRMVVGGGFSEPGNVAGVAAWNGTDFVAIGNGPNDRVQGVVHGLQARPEGLYIGGEFGWAGGIATDDLIRFDGQAWQHVGDDDDGGYAWESAISTLGEWRGRLVVGGRFSVAGRGYRGSIGEAISGIAAFDGNTWDTFGSGLGLQNGGAVLDMVAWRGGTVIVGNFYTAGRTITSRIAWFDGQRHHRIAEFNGVVSTAHVWQGDLIVSGAYDYIDGVPHTRTVRFDGSTWTDMGNILAADFVEYQGALYASIGGLGRWNGSSWDVVAQIGESHDLAVFNNRIYLGGLGSLFQTDGLFEYDGTSFRTVQNGPNSHVRALMVRGSELWVGGEFTRCGTRSILRLARFDGTNFTQVGSGIGAPGGGVRELVELDGSVYVGGDFVLAGSNSFLLRWDGAAFHSLGSGVNASVHAILPNQVTGDLLIGGDFFTARGSSTSNPTTIPCSKLARYRTRDAWADLGQGLGSSVGRATLIGRGAFALGNLLGWSLAGAPARAAGVHVLSLQRLDLPIFGGILVPSPDVTIGFTASPLGTSELALAVPTALPIGTPLFAQSWFFDSGMPNSFGSSNAVTATSR
ncbi:MAG: hypothetical protein AB7I19_11715 [Planctomycetota bacterium]